MRPGGDPIATLGRTLDEALGPLEERAEILRSGKLGLLDASRAGRGADENLLLVVDQFEEIFRVQRGRGEAAEFVRLLLAAVNEYEELYRIYVVITMRSDYLGETALFPGLPEALNESQYLVPRMTREQLREAIEGPAALGGVEVEPDLVEQLLKKTGEDPDELPVLQHLLMRMWEVRDELSGSALMRTAHMERVGGWDKALTNHAKAWYELLDPPRRALAKRIFQRLTERGDGARESRRPTKVRELAAVAEVGVEEVKLVVEHFRREGCNFLMASDEEITGRTVIDISHESLIRRWEDLRRWVEEETDSGKWYQRVEDASLLHGRGEGGWLVGPQLASALNARAQGRWNAAWARRYTSEPGLAPGSDWDPAPGGTVRSPGLGGGSGISLSIPPSGYVRATAFLDGSERAQTARRAARRLLLALAPIAALALFSFWNAGRRSEASARLRASMAVADPLARALLLREFAGVAGERELLDYHAAALQPIPLAVLRGPGEGAMMAAAFDAGRPGEVATVSQGGVLRWWRADDGERSACFVMGARSFEECAIPIPRLAPLTAAAFSDDGRWLAAAREDGSAWVGRSDGTGARVAIPARSGSVYVTALAFGPGSGTIAAGYNNYQVRTWALPSPGDPAPEVGAGILLGGASEEGEHTGAISGVAFDPRGRRVATASVDRTIRVWSLDQPSRPVQLLRLPGDEGDRPLKSVAFGPEGRWVLGTYDRAARIWRSDGRGAPTSLPIETLKENVVLNGSWFSADGSRVLAAFSDGRARVWKVRQVAGEAGESADAPDPRLETVASPLELAGHDAAVRAAAISADSTRIVTLSDDGTARVWSSEPGEPRVLGRHARRVESVAFSHDGTKVVSASDDETAGVWGLGPSVGSSRLAGHGDWVRGAAFSRDGTRVATAAEDGRWMIWRLPDPGDEPICSIPADKDSPNLSVAFDGSGSRLVTASRDGTAKIWDVKDCGVGSPARLGSILRGHMGWVWTAVFSPDGSRLLTASADKTARVWRVDSGEETQRLVGHRDGVLGAAFDPDGVRIVTASADGTARLWTAAPSGWVESTTLRHGERVSKAAFSSDGKWVVTASADRTARIWSAESGFERLVLQHASPVQASAFSPDGSLVVTGSEDGEVRLWRVTLPSLADYLGTASTACLDQGLRVRFLGESERTARSRQAACEGRHRRSAAAD
jgi:WD40 repeat protein